LKKGRRMYTFNTLSTSAPMGVGGQHETPSALTTGKTPYRFYRENKRSSGTL
jgi:hypothetical protein